MHLTKDDRMTIENNLNNNVPMKQIGRNINKHCSSISREIKNHYLEKLVLIEVKIAIWKIVLNLKKKVVLY